MIMPSFVYGSEISNDKENQIIVQFKDNPNVKNTKRLNSKTHLIKYNSPSDADFALKQYKKRSDVEFAEKNKKLTLFDAPNDTYYPNQWALPTINATQTWNYSIYAKKSVTVAIIDSGVDVTHPDLIGKILLNGYDFYSNTNNVTDTIGHGTAVSGIIAAHTNNRLGISGICGNFDVKILPLKVTSSAGDIYLSDEIEAIDYAIQQKVDVINLSMGSSDWSDIENSAIQNAIQNGITVVASAGNSGNSTYYYPASYDNVISVGAIASDKTKAYYSTYNGKVDLVAPGSNIYSCKIGGTYGYVNGTSFSAPMVSGEVAIVKALSPTLTPTQIEQILEITALDLGITGKDNQFGYGLLQNHEAVLKALNLTNTNHVEMLDNSLIMQYPIYKLSDGKEITSLNAVSDLTEATVIANRSSEVESVTILTALYNQDNKILSIKTATVEIPPNDVKIYSTIISVTNTSYPYSLKTFVLQNFNTLKPLIKPIHLK